METEATLEQALLMAAENRGLASVLQNVERTLLVAVVAKYPTRAAGAKALGLNRTTFIEKLRRYGLFEAREVKGHTRLPSEAAPV